MSKGNLAITSLMLGATGVVYFLTDGATALGLLFIIGVPVYLGVTRIQRIVAQHRAEREGFHRYNEEVRRRAAGL